MLRLTGKKGAKNKMNTLGYIAKVTIKKLDNVKTEMFVHDTLNTIARYKGKIYMQLNGGK